MAGCSDLRPTFLPFELNIFMSIEIEAKMRLTDRNAIVARLESVGATFVADLCETNSYFDSADGGLKSTDQGLRTRVEVASDGSITTTITHKGPRAHGRLKSREENELQVNNARDAAKLLGALGYQHVLTFEKRRTRYLLDGCRVELDELPVLGWYIEIEGREDKKVIAVRQKLGLDDQPLIKSSYIAMLCTHLQESHSEATVVKFDNGGSVLKG